MYTYIHLILCIILLPLIMNIDECWVRVVQELIKTEIGYCILPVCHLSHSDDPMYSIFCLSLCIVLSKCASFLNVKTFWASSYKICLLVQFCFWSFAAIFHIIIYTDPPHTYSFCSAPRISTPPPPFLSVSQVVE